MAKDNIIPFPTAFRGKPATTVEKLHKYQARIEEIKTENKLIQDDIKYLNEVLGNNAQELEEIIFEMTTATVFKGTGIDTLLKELLDDINENPDEEK
jgi:uncharacterized protein (UPF0335 family)